MVLRSGNRNTPNKLWCGELCKLDEIRGENEKSLIADGSRKTAKTNLQTIEPAFDTKLFLGKMYSPSSNSLHSDK